MKDGLSIVRKITAGRTEAKIFICPELLLPAFLKRDILESIHLDIPWLFIIKTLKNRGNILVQSGGESQYHSDRSY